MPTPHPDHRLSPRVASLARRAACGALAVGAATAFAQTGLGPASPTTPSPAASSADVPGRLRPTPKVTGPSDAQRSLNLNNAQPEGRVTPQIRLPLGKKPDGPILQRRPTDTGSSAAPNGGIDDAAAYCEAQRSEQSRVKCRSQLASPAGR